MSTGGTYTILAANNGHQDKFLMATQDLKDRLKALSRAKLTELQMEERNKNKTRSEILRSDRSWIPELSAIEQTHIIHTNSSFKPFVAVGHEYIVSTVSMGNQAFDSTVEFNIPQYGEFLADMCVHVRLGSLVVTDVTNQAKLCDYVGHRLFEEVTLRSGGNILDTYTPQMAQAFYEHEVPVHKRAAYRRAIGQEDPIKGYVVPDPTANDFRLEQNIYEGNQTMKRTHVETDLWIPLWFWFRDYKQAIPQSLIPHGQTKVVLKIAPRSSLVVMGLASPSSLTGEALLNSSSGITSAFSIKKMELITNHIFMLPEVFEIFTRKFGMHLCRIHKVHEETVSTDSGSILLSSLVWPVESIYMAFHPVVNDTGNDDAAHLVDQGSCWHVNNFVQRQTADVAVITSGPVIGSNSLIYYRETQPIDQISVESHGVKLFSQLQAGFFSDYLPFSQGENRVASSSNGWFQLNFSLNPGMFQPAGHLNMSRAREFYVNYDSSLTYSTRLASTAFGYGVTTLIASTNTVKFQAIATCLNILLIQDGSMTLRYAT